MTEQTATAVVKVDGDKLAEALRRVVPFMGEGNPPNLAAVYVEARDGVLQLTACDGHRMAHLTVALPFVVGNFLMKAQGAKEVSQRHYNGAGVEVKVGEGDKLGMIEIGEVAVELETTPYIDYPAVVPEDLDTEVIIDPKVWIKVIRQHKPERVGIFYSSSGCKMYLQNGDWETTACEMLPVQVMSGPEKKVAYPAEHLRRALTSCGTSATISVGDPLRATLFEADDYWHILMPIQGFPKEVTMTNTERELLKWAQDAIDAIRKGEAPGIIQVGGGKFYLELRPDLAASQVIVREPKLAEETEVTAVMAPPPTVDDIQEAAERATGETPPQDVVEAVAQAGQEAHQSAEDALENVETASDTQATDTDQQEPEKI